MHAESIMVPQNRRLLYYGLFVTYMHSIPHKLMIAIQSNLRTTNTSGAGSLLASFCRPLLMYREVVCYRRNNITLLLVLLVKLL